MARTVTDMSADEFAAAADVSRETLERLEVYSSLLVKWQGAINLVGADSLADIWRRHMLDSAQLADYIPRDAAVITDLGSGAGFPGLVLSIILDRPVHLVEASGKKAAFLREVVRLTNAPAIVQNRRIERGEAWQSDVVVARALAPLALLLEYAEPFLQGAGTEAACLFLKGVRVEEELTEVSKSWTMKVERFQSVSDPSGIILRIRDIARDGHSE
jgi:16S rRNA (guanine527-N7)-methyltransferase